MADKKDSWIDRLPGISELDILVNFIEDDLELRNRTRKNSEKDANDQESDPVGPKP